VGLRNENIAKTGPGLDIFQYNNSLNSPFRAKKNIVCLFVYSHKSYFSAIWWLSPLPVTELQI
jgi:hypothetical protein